MTSARIAECFARARAEQRTALIAFLTVGDPSPEDTTACALAALEAGADVLELGVPFSDPTADGPVIAAAAHRAIRQGGSLRAALRVAEAVRARSEAPLILFSYMNPVIAAGETALPALAGRAGVDGLLVVDLPLEEGGALRDAADAAGLAMIPLIAPTTGPAREPRVLARASGFIYYVSLTGVTGSAEAPLTEAGRRAAELARRSTLPVCVGFGIDSPEKARAVADTGVDGVVVGTALVRAIAAEPTRARRVEAVTRLVARLRQRLDER